MDILDSDNVARQCCDNAWRGRVVHTTASIGTSVRRHGQGCRGHRGRAALVHAVCRCLAQPAELGVLVPVERDCLSVRLSGRDLLPALRMDWMARVVTHCVVLSAFRRTSDVCSICYL